MGGLLSRRSTKAYTKQRKLHRKEISSSQDDLLSCHVQVNVTDGKAKIFKSSSTDDLGVGEFQTYVTGKIKSNTMISDSDFEKECIKEHNQYRSSHNSGLLQQKKELTRHAQDWANTLAATEVLRHSNHRTYGENIAMTTKQSPTAFADDDAKIVAFGHPVKAKEMIAMWYDEISKYNFKSPGFSLNTGHFTQVVWKSTTHVGIGIARGARGTYVVANYEPAGNISNSGYFEKNVFPSGRRTYIYNNAKVKRKDSSSSSASSSSNDDDQRKFFNSKDNKTETSVKTKVEEYTDEKGRKVRKTTKTTTTTATKNGKTSTSTKSEVSTEYIGDSGSSSSKGPENPDKVTKNVKKMKISDGKESKMSSSDRKKFEEECIKRHNELRKKHGAPPLKRSSKLQEKAQNWADHILTLRRMQHSNEKDMGENVAYKYSSDKRRFKGDEIADMWYDEIHQYNFNNPGFSSGTGHFTQLVWDNAKEVGIGVAADGQGTIYAVANYYPPGNFRGEFEKNVKPPRH